MINIDTQMLTVYVSFTDRSDVSPKIGSILEKEKSSLWNKFCSKTNTEDVISHIGDIRMVDPNDDYAFFHIEFYMNKVLHPNNLREALDAIDSLLVSLTPFSKDDCEIVGYAMGEDGSKY